MGVMGALQIYIDDDDHDDNTAARLFATKAEHCKLARTMAD